MSCLLQCRIVNSFMFPLLKPTNRDISKRAEVHTSKGDAQKCALFVQPSRGASLLTCLESPGIWTQRIHVGLEIRLSP